MASNVSPPDLPFYSASARQPMLRRLITALTILAWIAIAAVVHHLTRNYRGRTSHQHKKAVAARAQQPLSGSSYFFPSPGCGAPTSTAIFPGG
jgi:hypothetical protein